jgi:polyribonucleotide nucleotidyltransferase
MLKVVKKSIEWGRDTLTLETGKIARQADATIIATYGETSVLAAVVFAKESKPGQGFFPLTVNYQEKYYAAGKIPGGFFQKRGKTKRKGDLNESSDR